jgi:hypothetical protein
MSINLSNIVLSKNVKPSNKVTLDPGTVAFGVQNRDGNRWIMVAIEDSVASKAGLSNGSWVNFGANVPARKAYIIPAEDGEFRLMPVKVKATPNIPERSGLRLRFMGDTDDVYTEETRRIVVVGHKVDEESGIIELSLNFRDFRGDALAAPDESGSSPEEEEEELEEEELEEEELEEEEEEEPKPEPKPKTTKPKSKPVDDVDELLDA